MVTVTGDVWLGVYVSSNGGATWFNTMVPGFPSDTLAAGLASPLQGLDASGDPVVRFDRDGNLFVAAIAFNRNFDQPDRPVDDLVYVARYDYTPGPAGGTSTPNSAANPPNFAFARSARGPWVADLERQTLIRLDPRSNTLADRSSSAHARPLSRSRAGWSGWP